jgi:hypothetical protein
MRVLGRPVSAEKRTRTASLSRIEVRATSREQHASREETRNVDAPREGGRCFAPRHCLELTVELDGEGGGGARSEGPGCRCSPFDEGALRSMGQPKWSRRRRDLRVLRRPTVEPPWAPFASAVARPCSPSMSDAATAREMGHVSASDYPRALACTRVFRGARSTRAASRLRGESSRWCPG